MKIRIIDLISFILESYLDIYKGEKKLYEIVDETNKGVLDQATRLIGWVETQTILCLDYDLMLN